MKRAGFPLLSVLLLVSCEIEAQISSTTVCTVGVSPPCTQPLQDGDTINGRDCLCLGSSVIAFEVIAMKSGCMSEWNVTGSCFTATHDFTPGTKVICSRIVTEPWQGVHVRQPSRTLVVK